jgi:hypothetical protein
MARRQAQFDRVAVRLAAAHVNQSTSIGGEVSVRTSPAAWRTRKVVLGADRQVVRQQIGDLGVADQRDAGIPPRLGGDEQRVRAFPAPPRSRPLVPTATRASRRLAHSPRCNRGPCAVIRDASQARAE